MSALRIATRRSDLAMAQAGIVRLMLKQQGRDAVLLPVDTTGDREGGADKDRWIDAIVELLRAGRADLAVHSAKDLPADDPEDLVIAAVPERADPRDVLVAGDDAYFDGDAPRRGARVGTSSLRRAAQLRAAFPGVELVDLHGNVPTRVRKLQEDGGPDVVVLAAAGLDRLGLTPPIVKPLAVDIVLPAPGQGTLAIQCRADDRPLRAALSVLEHGVSATTLHAERALTRALAGDCNLPLGAFAQVHGDVVRLAACVATPDGSNVVRATVEAPDAEHAAKLATAELLDQGAGDILDAVRAR
ncbi:MAG TPA: hydroxymethylbilane synthase [Actinomycetota bacterium]|nr:hydroxymethylbilane synthase [Actinomycetota bacterium]